MLTTPSSDQSALWNLPSSVNRQRFAVSVAEQTSLKLPELLRCSLSVESISEQSIVDVYYDTKNFSLFKKGYACCLRNMRNQSALCLVPVTAIGATDTRRESLVMTMPLQKVADTLRIRTLASGEVKGLLRSLLNEKKLYKQFRVRTRRAYFEFTEPPHRSPLMLDRVSIKSSRTDKEKASASVHYNELIVTSGGVGGESIVSLERKLKPKISIRQSNTNAFRRAIEMDAKRLTRRAPTGAVAIPSDRSGHDLFRAHMRTQLNMLEYWEKVAVEGSDKEGVHQMRVSIRRIRAALKTFAPLLSKSETTHWHAEFRWLAKRLGGVRDLDVFAEWLEQGKVVVADADADADADAEECHHLGDYQSDVSDLYHYARQGLLSSLGSDRYSHLLADFCAWIEQEQCFFINNALTWKPTQELSDMLIKRAVQRIARKIKAIGKQSPAEQLHRFRVECKRVRYSLDMLEGAASESHQELISKLKCIQQVLGNHQDACERSKRIQQYAKGESALRHGQDFVFYLGTLFAEQQRDIDRCVKEFHPVRKAALLAIKKAVK